MSRLLEPGRRLSQESDEWHRSKRRVAETAFTLDSLSFTLPESLEAHEPAEARGIARDGVRLMVTYPDTDSIIHTNFIHFPEFLRAGDVLVVNTSGTINAAIPASCISGEAVELHLSQRLPNEYWVVEARLPSVRGTEPWLTAAPGERLTLPADGVATLLEPYPQERSRSLHPSTGAHENPVSGGTRLWVASVHVEGPLIPYLNRYGSPIRYGYVPRVWPLRFYQTIFSREAGSAEMPSAGRAFTPRVLQALADRGVSLAPILLHTGVASLEANEPPYPEFFRVSAAAARTVNGARSRGGRIVAVGTTAVRALETVATADGTVSPAEWWTDLVITPARGIHTVHALLTGFHEPRASHL